MMIAGTAIYSASIKWTGSNVKRIDDVVCYLPATSYPEEVSRAFDSGIHLGDCPMCQTRASSVTGKLPDIQIQ